mgnify:CR=1 FL=1
MAKTVRSEADPFLFHYPASATIVTSHARDRDNAMAVAWHTAASRKPAMYLVSISYKRFTFDLIVESGEFVVNFMPRDQGELVAKVAGCSGRDVDKFQAFQIAAKPGSRVKAAVLDTSLAAYECRLVDRHTYGDHDLFVGEVVAVQWEASAFTSEGLHDLERAPPIVYLGEDRYATAVGNDFLDREALVKAHLQESSA